MPHDAPRRFGGLESSHLASGPWGTEWRTQVFVEKEMVMAQKMISLRISTVLLERLENLMEVMRHDPKYSPRGKLTRAEVIRETILCGCEVLEREHMGRAAGGWDTHSNHESLHGRTPQSGGRGRFGSSASQGETAFRNSGGQSSSEQARSENAQGSTHALVPVSGSGLPAMTAQERARRNRETTTPVVSMTDEKDSEFEPF
jgi:hypothetical protein